ncbi:MAG: superoxide dismutase [Bacteroidia bacterium]|nr:superoxide dismutase [Bacteroidia bacterium]MBP6657498.1 superoxide dismutase [Bacteroidia bacterium]
MESSRRDFLKKGSLLAVAGIGSQILGSSIAKAASALTDEEEYSTFSLGPLPYSYDALEPHIDKQTMEIHYTKHHQAYVNNLNAAMKADKIKSTLTDLMKNTSKYSASIRNNAGGHWNHTFFWETISPSAGGSPKNVEFSTALSNSFGSFEDFVARFEETASKRFGSGWAWLIQTADRKLVITSTPNQDNPLMDVATEKGTPILGLDVWEHAYYLKYQNRRADYVKAWWNLVNWDKATQRYLGI